MSELTCSAKMGKALLFLSTFLVALAGLFMFGCGIWFVSAPSSFIDLLYAIDDDGSFQQLVRAAGGIIIGIGLLLSIVGIAGCWGSLTNKTGCLTCFQALLVIFIIMQIIATVLAGVFHTQLSNELRKSMYKAINESNGYANNTAITTAWDVMQQELHCCGVVNHTDWTDSWWARNNIAPGKVVPDSCCNDKGKSDNSTACNVEARTPPKEYTELYHEGCETKLEDWFRHYWGVLIGIVVGVIVIELGGIVLSCCVASATKKAYEYV